MGPASILALLAGAALCLLIALCFAEVGSRFQGTGGAYLYAKEAFGDFVGFEVGWMTCCVAVIAWAALANGFSVVLAHFIPAVGEGWLQKVTTVGLMGGLAAVNMLGAKQGAAVSTFFSIAKLVPLFIFVGVGVFYVSADRFVPFSPSGVGEPLAETTLLLLYAFVGFETLVVPAGEMADPKRSVPRALMVVMVAVSLVYTAVFLVTLGVLDGIAGHKNPVAAAATAVLGARGGEIVAAGIVVSAFGVNAGAALVSPRRFFALSERGDLPRFLSKVHPKTGAPVAAIMATFTLAALLSLTGSFEELAKLSVLARFLQYIPTCLAVIWLRRRGPHDGFTLPFGPTLPLLSIAACIWLMVNSDHEKLLWGVAALGVGAVLFLAVRTARSRA
jgi:amino acid transporter